jgi:hypothetical protein
MFLKAEKHRRRQSRIHHMGMCVCSIGILCLNIFNDTSPSDSDIDCYTIIIELLFFSWLYNNTVCTETTASDDRMINKCGAAGRMRICRRKQGTLRKPVPLPLCPPQISHGLTWKWMWASMVGSWHLTVLESYYILFSTYDGTQNCHNEDPVEHEGLFCYEVTYSRYNMF